mmetsp:Transcript_62486/g.181173  ORF Transcript_62486/g.181173 Transcript_62486/m.181173 type:complete len:84 (-) Transcript_62486:90-341(-)
MWRRRPSRTIRSSDEAKDVLERAGKVPTRLSAPPFDAAMPRRSLLAVLRGLRAAEFRFDPPPHLVRRGDGGGSLPGLRARRAR